MEPQAILALTVSRNLATTAHSAHPNAPVISTDDTTPVAARLRDRAAAGLRRAADLISPPERRAPVPLNA